MKMETVRPNLAIRAVVVMKKTRESLKISGYLMINTRKPKKTNMNTKEEASIKKRNRLPRRNPISKQCLLALLPHQKRDMTILK